MWTTGVQRHQQKKTTDKVWARFEGLDIKTFLILQNFIIWERYCKQKNIATFPDQKAISLNLKGNGQVHLGKILLAKNIATFSV